MTKKYYCIFLLALGLCAGLNAQPANSLSAPVPDGFRNGFARGDGTNRIHYVIGGKGPPLLLVHGWPETWYEWRKVMPLLSHRFTVIAVDLRGFGDSDVTPAGYDKKTLASDLHEVMKSLGYDTAIVVGHDWGGPVAYAYAAQYRNAVTQLVLIEGSPFGPWMPTTEPYWFFHFFRIQGYAEKMLPGKEHEFLDYFFRNDEFHVVPGAFTDESINMYENALSRPGRMQPSCELYRTIDQDVRDNTVFAATPLTVPVLAIGARRGAGEFAIAAARHVAARVTPVVMENTGHFIPEERPAVLAETIEGFIDGKNLSPVWKQ